MNNAVVGLIFESVGEILWCDHSNKSYWALLSSGAVCYSVQGSSNREFDDEILRCDLSIKSYSAVLSNGAICFSAFYKMEVGNFVEFFFLFVGVEELKGHDENPPTILCKTREGNLNHSLRRSPPCKGIQDNLGFWIPRCGFQIPDTIEFLLWVSLWIKLWILCKWSSHSGIQ